MYEALLGERQLPIVPPACRKEDSVGGAAAGKGDSGGSLPAEEFLSRARFHMMSVGLMTARSAAPAAERKEGDPVAASDVRMTEGDKCHVPKFLNRLLGMSPEAQKMIFDFFQELLDLAISKARQTGEFDDGIVDVKGDIYVVGKPSVVYRDSFSQADTLHTTLQVDRGVSWGHAKRMLELGIPTAFQLEQHDREKSQGGTSAATGRIVIDIYRKGASSEGASSELAEINKPTPRSSRLPTD
uniref:Protein strawberry notch-like n=2 Tax=Tetraselmis sp. GSL018 TaxID=582737 RepID=A0A061QQX6_9CHLO